MDAIANGWGEKCYDYIDKFQTEFSSHIGSRFSIATSSCTGALHLGLAALGIGPEDEVILADTNWIATVAPIVHLGATPVFVDIDPVYWCIDPDKVRTAITPRTKAIIATHIYGNLCDLDALKAIGEDYGIPFIEDAAEALGSEYKGLRAGSIGIFGVFSFHGSKTMTTGEGGIFVTNDEELFERSLSLSNHGRVRGQIQQFWPEMIGFKYKMSNVQAALGYGQLQRIDELIQRKREIMNTYRMYFGNQNSFSINEERPECRNGDWMPTVVWGHKSSNLRDELRNTFLSIGIDARVFFPALSSLKMFPNASTPHAHNIPKRALNLPSFHDMTDDQIYEVSNVVLKILEKTEK
jgi:perosamine synthetase